jgi:hypothetical protein
LEEEMLRTLAIVIGVLFSANCNEVPTAQPAPNAGERYLRAAARPGVTPVHKAAYEQLAQLHAVDSAEMYDGWGPPLAQFFTALQAPSMPISILNKIGYDALPVLVDALDDNTPTKTVTPARPWRDETPRVWKVNELVAALICRIAAKDFTASDRGRNVGIVAVGDLPELAPRFRKAVLDWYGETDKMLKDMPKRRIEDVNCDMPTIQFAAVEWLGLHKINAGQHAVLICADRLLTGDSSISGGDDLMAECALTLGRLGDKSTLAVVRRICKRLTERGRFDDVGQRNLSAGYHGLALLGEKGEALRDLKQLYDIHASLLSDEHRKSFERLLEVASKW